MLYWQMKIEVQNGSFRKNVINWGYPRSLAFVAFIKCFAKYGDTNLVKQGRAHSSIFNVTGMAAWTKHLLPTQELNSHDTDGISKSNSSLPLLIFRGQTQNQAGKNETVNTRCVVDGRSSSDLRPTLGRRVGRRQLEAAYQAAVTAVNTRAQLLTIYPRVKHCWVYISGQIRFTNNYTIQIHPMRRLVF